MPIRGRKAAVEEGRRPAAKDSLIASAVEIAPADLFSWRTYPLGRDQAWQAELWRLYDIVGEFRFAANWVGSMLSQVRIFVAEVDEHGKIGKQVDDPQIQGLADSMLGGPAAQAEALRLMGVNLTVAGEFYIVGWAARGERDDQWFVVTPTELTRWAGGTLYNYEGGPIQLFDNVDMLIRVWTPHPKWVWRADSPSHGAMQVIVEIERLTRYVFSQIDSRLYGAGLLAIPNDMDFPDNDDSTGAADSLMHKLGEAGTASMKGEGSATGVLPVIAEFPAESIGKIQHITFESPLSEEARELREEAIKRFAYSMDFPPEVITGQGSSNHWSAWYVDENAIKVHVQPLMVRICDALTRAYLRLGLKKLGLDPKKYCYWYDTSGLTARPTRLADALNLFKERLLSGKAVRDAGFFREDEAMSAEESAELFGRDVVLRDPTQLASEGIRKIVGLGPDILPEGSYAPPPPPPVPQSGALPGRMGAVPARSSTPPDNANAGAQPAVTASATPDMSVTLALITGANMVVHRALGVAGKRLLTRDQRSRWKDVPEYELHTKIRVRDAEHAQTLLAGAWVPVPLLIDLLGDTAPVNGGALTDALNRYATNLLVMERPHDPDDLLETLRREGLVDG